MKLGIFHTTQYDLETDPSVAWERYSRHARLIDDSGFHSIWVGEHHVTSTSQYFQPIPTIANLGAITNRVQLGIGALLLPLHNPIYIAELGGVLDVITGGRFTMACGLGYRDAEFAMFGVDKAERVGRLVEGVRLIKRLWSEENVTFDGEYFSVENISINPKPLQNPLPLLLAGYVDAAAKRSAKIANGWMYGNIADKDEIKRQLELYEKFRDEFNRRNVTKSPIMLREGFVLDDDREAFETVEPYLKGKFEGYENWGLEGLNMDTDFEDFCQNRFIIGDPETAIDELTEYAELGIEHIILRVRYPGIDEQAVEKCLQTLADEVIPHIDGA